MSTYVLGLAAAYGLTVGVARLFVVAALGDRVELFGSMCVVPSHVAAGAVLALLVARRRPVAVRLAGVVAAAVITATSLATFHYWAVFGGMPGTDALYYIGEVRHLLPSLELNAPWPWLVVEGAGCLLVTAAAGVALERATPRAPVPVQATVALVAAAGLVVTVASPSAGTESAQLPAVAFVRAIANDVVYRVPRGELRGDDVRLVRTRLGRPPHGPLDPALPLCDSPRPAPAPNGRGAILLILESVGIDELEAEHDGRAVMPTLQRIAAAGLSFSDFFAAGTKSCQALPALFAGLPAQTSTNILWHEPLNTVQGFPSLLREYGYRTAYFHGGDLAFEQQRRFLEMAGFEEIQEYDPLSDTPVYGWGYSDRTMFERLRSWLEAHGDEPAFVTLFTLSTHDPYAIPADAPAIAQGDSRRARYLNALAFADAELQRFYDWYVNTLRERGTLLVVTGDHTHLQHADSASSFRVPLVIDGLTDEEHRRFAAFTGRVGAQFDVPSTLATLLGTWSGPCDLGSSLLATAFPAERWVYSVGRDSRSLVVVRTGVWSAAYDRRSKRIGLTGAGDDVAVAVDEFVQRLLPLSYFLVSENAFAPPRTTATPSKAIDAGPAPIVVSHRGNADGADSAGNENRLEAIRRAVAAGFDTVEVDLNVTADGVPVLIHDPTFTDRLGATRAVADVTYETFHAETGRLSLDELLAQVPEAVGFVLEAKPQRQAWHAQNLAHAVARVARRHRERRAIIVDSLDTALAASIRRHCDCEVGLDAPVGEPLTDAWLDSAVAAGMNWVFLSFDAVDAEGVRRAHARGLKVMLYTINDVSQLADAGIEGPDGVITDARELLVLASGRR